MWKVGDRVRFAHQQPDGPIREISDVQNSTYHSDEMVQLKDMRGGWFGAHIFVRVKETRDGLPTQERTKTGTGNTTV